MNAMLCDVLIIDIDTNKDPLVSTMIQNCKQYTGYTNL